MQYTNIIFLHSFGLCIVVHDVTMKTQLVVLQTQFDCCFYCFVFNINATLLDKSPGAYCQCTWMNYFMKIIGLSMFFTFLFSFSLFLSKQFPFIFKSAFFIVKSSDLIQLSTVVWFTSKNLGKSSSSTNWFCGQSLRWQKMANEEAAQLTNNKTNSDQHNDDTLWYSRK